MDNTSKKLKIAFFSEDFSRQAKGTALVVQKLAEQFISNFSNRVELTLIRKAGFCNHPIARKIRNVEIKIYPAPVFSTIISYLIFFLIYKEKFDIIMFNKFVYPGFWLLNSKKFVLLVHDIPVSPTNYKEKLMLSSKIFYAFLGLIGKRYLDALIADSKDARQGVIKYHRVEPSKVFAVYIAAGDEFRKFSEPEKIEAKKILEESYGIIQPYILDVSRLDPHKNIETLIDAFFILKQKHGIPHKLVIVGGKHLPAYSRLIEDKIADLSLNQDIIIAPYIEEKDLPAVYNLAEVLAFPSLIEGFGLPLVEAMKCGTPVIASDIPVMKEVTSGAAMLTDPFNAELLADRILAILNNPQLRRELVEKGLRRAGDFSWQKTAANFLKIYEDCLSR